MQPTIYKFRQYFKLNKILPLGLIFLLASCIHSAKYVATYSVQSKTIDKGPKEISIDFINQLADKNSLSKDPIFNGIDTLGFFGRPYHYFKFWFEQKDSNTIIKLDYWGMFRSRKKQPYRDMFNEFRQLNF